MSLTETTRFLASREVQQDLSFYPVSLGFIRQLSKEKTGTFFA